MSTAIYTLSAATALACCWFLLRAYMHGGYRLLLWSGICFAGLTLNNVLLVLDKLVFPLVDLSPWRNLVALLAMATLLYGLIWDTE
jgi:hypothetical protein